MGAGLLDKTLASSVVSESGRRRGAGAPWRPPGGPHRCPNRRRERRTHCQMQGRQIFRAGRQIVAPGLQPDIKNEGASGDMYENTGEDKMSCAVWGALRSGMGALIEKDVKMKVHPAISMKTNSRQQIADPDWALFGAMFRIAATFFTNLRPFFRNRGPSCHISNMGRMQSSFPIAESHGGVV